MIYTLSSTHISVSLIFSHPVMGATGENLEAKEKTVYFWLLFQCRRQVRVKAVA